VGTAVANLVKCNANIVIDNAVAHRSRRLIVGSGVDREHYLVKIPALGILLDISNGLLRAMPREIDQHQIASTRALGERRKRAKNSGASGTATALREAWSALETISQYDYMLARKTAISQCTPHQGDIIGRSF